MITIFVFILNRQAKDVVRGIKKRINSRNPRVQLLALTVSSFLFVEYILLSVSFSFY